MIFWVLCRQDLRPERWNGHFVPVRRPVLSSKPLPSEAEPFKFAPEPSGGPATELLGSPAILKDFALECIAEEATRQNLSPLIREKVRAKTLREISKQTESFSTHWAQFSARDLAKVKDLEAYVKRRLVAAGDFKNIQKK